MTSPRSEYVVFVHRVDCADTGAGSQIGPKFDAPTESHFACPRIIFLKSVLRAMQLRDCKDLVYHLDQGISSI